MTTWRQIAANRRNAEKSTGPRTEAGKRRSRGNALRHGLCAETVVEMLEDVEDYKAFEVAIASEYDAQSVVERELVLRLASLLWRIRRATGIETALLGVHAEIKARGRSLTLEPLTAPEARRPESFDVFETLGDGASWGDAGDCREHVEDLSRDFGEGECLASASFRMSMRDLAHCFKALADADHRVFERLGRYEAALWRQIVQTLFALQSARRRFSPALARRWCDKE
jgi:hypothetical protein